MPRTFSTFYIHDRLYGLEVLSVQEITKFMPITKVPLAPDYVSGLINLRGQIATAIHLGKLFEVEESSGNSSDQKMNVVCRAEGNLLALLVDKIGDVVEVEDELFENTPDTIPHKISVLMEGVYKTPGKILSILNVNKIIDVISN